MIRRGAIRLFGIGKKQALDELINSSFAEMSN